jgi:hypothetical protein
VRAIWNLDPPAGRKPLYVTEYGVRGLRTFNGVKADPGFWANGTPLTQTNVNAFQHAWFDVLSARAGYLGTVKWDSYFGKYDNSPQAYYMIGPPPLWAEYPVYWVLRLWTSSVKPSWQVVGLDLAGGPKVATAYRGPADALTVIGLDRDGAQLNGASGTDVQYRVGGVAPNQTLQLKVWNATGDGTIAPARTVTADDAGVATFSVPLQGVFALTRRGV